MATKKGVLFIAAASLLAIVISFAYFQSGAVVYSDSLNENEPNAELANNQSQVKSPSEAIDGTRSFKKTSPVDKYGDSPIDLTTASLADFNDLNRVLDGEVAAEFYDLKKAANYLCEKLQFHQESDFDVINTEDQQGVLRKAALQSWTEAFCNTHAVMDVYGEYYLESVEHRLAYFEELGYQEGVEFVDLENLMLLSQDEESRIEAAESIFQIAESTNNPYLFYQALNAMLVVPHESWRPDGYPEFEINSPVQLRSDLLEGTGAIIAYCEISNRCNPGAPFVVHMCYPNNCPPSLDLNDYFNEFYSPNDLREARRFADYFISIWNSGG